jgi:NO-binding membrane sensor protein with MHYT domain
VAEVHHFTYGWITLALSYGVAVLGSFLGLLCTARARDAHTRVSRARWLALAAPAIGGSGIWLMHFAGMIGFTVEGSDIRYDPTLTAGSAVLAIVVVGIGLFVVGYGKATAVRIVAGGTFAGLGVAGMHYTGMAAMNLQGSLGYRGWLVLASVVIAVVAATAALWFTVVTRRMGLIVLASLIMGVAVTGMHFTGMAAVRVRLDPAIPALDGVSVTTMLPPVALVMGLAVTALLYGTLTAPTSEDRDDAQRYDRLVRERAMGRSRP